MINTLKSMVVIGSDRYVYLYKKSFTYFFLKLFVLRLETKQRFCFVFMTQMDWLDISFHEDVKTAEWSAHRGVVPFF